jgi:4-hydroxy-tetrahydrodipicolinate reductase
LAHRLSDAIMRAMAQLLIVGAGPVGTGSALAAVKDGVVDGISGVVDPDPTSRAELEAATGAPGFGATVDVPVAREGDRALVAYSSDAAVVSPQIVRLVAAGYHVVTTCEELAWPPRHIWQAMHTAARSDGRTILVAGANPGFIMDQFPLMAAGASRNVTSILVVRRIDTSDRRASLVTKSGRGLSPNEFAAGFTEGELGHKGLTESARLLAHGLKWPNHDVNEVVDPIIRDGVVTGVEQVATLRSDGKRIELRLVLDWRLSNPGDTVVIDGSPPVHIEIEGGYHGDLGTTAQVVRALARCVQLDPGFYRPIDMPLRFG